MPPIKGDTPIYDKTSEVSPLTRKKGDKGAYNDDPAKPFLKTDFKKRTNQFHWVYSDEPHASRRKEILLAHPEIRKLFVKEIRTAYIVLGLIIAQLWVCSWISKVDWLTFFLVMYIFGGTVNHTLQLANHEISHNLVFENLHLNMLLGIAANFVTGVPSSVTFRVYHMDHHQYQGVDVIDTDIPSTWELRMFRNKVTKFFWVIGQAFAYAIRPVLTAPKPITKYQILNTVMQLSFDYFIIYNFFGFYGMLYIIGSSLIGLGLHPAAGHFIAEHYEFVNGFETYSYYGCLNYVNFNVGYHNEHHDFPKIPWSKLPLVRKIAPEWYDHLPHHDSYTKVIYKYIMDDNIGPWSRVKRKDCARQRKSQKKQN